MCQPHCSQGWKVKQDQFLRTINLSNVFWGRCQDGFEKNQMGEDTGPGFSGPNGVYAISRWTIWSWWARYLCRVESTHKEWNLPQHLKSPLEAAFISYLLTLWTPAPSDSPNFSSLSTPWPLAISNVISIGELQLMPFNFRTSFFCTTGTAILTRLLIRNVRGEVTFERKRRVEDGDFGLLGSIKGDVELSPRSPSSSGC